MENQYKKSPEMIHMQTKCLEEKEDLKKMDITRRFYNDNRIPTWTFGMVNFSFDQNFIQNGLIINDTDDRVQTIIDDNQEGTGREITGTRNIKFNGSWFKM